MNNKAMNNKTMNHILNKLLKLLATSTIALILASCGSSGSGSGSDSGSGGSSGFNATVVAAKVFDATCFTTPYTNGVAGSPTASVKTDKNGLASFPAANSGRTLISCTGGTYTDEATGATATAVTGTLTAAILAVTGGAYVVSPLTDLAAKRGTLNQAIDKYNSEVARQFGLGTTSIVATVPTDLETADSIDPDNTNDQYAIILAAISQIGANTQNTDTAAVIAYLGRQNATSIKTLIDTALNDLENASNTASTVANLIDTTATATVKDNNTNTAVVQTVTFAIDTASIFVGNSISVQAEALPANAADTSVSYSSANTDIATVGTITGVVTGINVGTVIISATANDNSNISDTISIDVNALDIIISPATLSVDEGGTGFYTVVLNAQPTGNVTITPTSDNTAAATTSAALSFTTANWDTAQNITITTVKDSDAADETVTITNTASGGGYDGISKDVTINISVAAVAVTSVAFANASANIVIGNTITVSATVSPANATDKSVSYSSADTNIATVDATTGVVSAVAAGSTVITATANGDNSFTDTININVIDDSITVTAPATLTAVATGEPNQVEISWAEVADATGYTLYSTTNTALVAGITGSNPDNLPASLIYEGSPTADTSMVIDLTPGGSTTYYVVTATKNSVESLTNATATAATAFAQAFTTVAGGTIDTPTGTVWMDRNLGASQKATSSTDAASYGDLYQWGRPRDGHQNRTSPSTATRPASITPNHGDFITNNSNDWSNNVDNNGADRSAFWGRIDGSGICPTGFNVPTVDQLRAEFNSWSTKTSVGAFASNLKWPIAGYRDRGNAALGDVGSNGYVWSRSTIGDGGTVYFHASFASISSTPYIYGYSVRCIKAN